MGPTAYSDVGCAVVVRTDPVGLIGPDVLLLLVTRSLHCARARAGDAGRDDRLTRVGHLAIFGRCLASAAATAACQTHACIEGGLCHHRRSEVGLADADIDLVAAAEMNHQDAIR